MTDIKKYLLILFASIILFGCSEEDEGKKINIGFREFRSAVFRAIEGHTTANDSLKGLIDPALPLATSINQIVIDSIVNKDRVRFYYCLLEYPNPIYNRFAIYDSSLNLYLMDKSLNGNLTIQTAFADSLQYLEVFEDYISNDKIHLKRWNIYVVMDYSASLALRTFLEYNDSVKSMKQNVSFISRGVIATKLDVPKSVTSNYIEDEFIFNRSLLKFESLKNEFDRIVFDEVDNFKSNFIRHQIVDQRSALVSAGVITQVDSTLTTEKTKISYDGFYIKIPEDWKIIRNVAITKQITRPVRGTYFLNTSLGASFSVIKIGSSDLVSFKTEPNFKSRINRDYTIKESDLMEVRKNYIQFFEISCGYSSYVVIFEVPIYTYREQRGLFESIINSFGVDC